MPGLRESPFVEVQRKYGAVVLRDRILLLSDHVCQVCHSINLQMVVIA